MPNAKCLASQFFMKQINVNKFIFCFGKCVVKFILFFGTKIKASLTSGLLILDLGKLGIDCWSSFLTTSRTNFPVVINSFYMVV